eukprot:TRINITY_DN17593_c0_g2_i1.p1 TRINITY_DN17593_c0_g2~~TRINITY_DN17593_c0_g2_i1.p1  ORF type:complete len:268 (-),score=59.11 TRINITY_DN17593_c0_g2_i1:214-948(-)
MSHHHAGFFDKQRIDEAGNVAVRLQKVIIAVLVFYIIDFILSIVEVTRGGNVATAFFPLLPIAWVIFGFFSAYQRQPGQLNVYGIIWVILLVLASIVIILDIVAVAALVAIIGNAAGHLDYCGQDCEALLVVLVLSFIIAIVVYILNIYQTVLVFRLRNMLRTTYSTTVVYAPVPGGPVVYGAIPGQPGAPYYATAPGAGGYAPQQPYQQGGVAYPPPSAGVAYPPPGPYSPPPAGAYPPPKDV